VPAPGPYPGQVATLRNPAGAYLPPSAVLPPAEALPLPSAKATKGDTNGEASAAGGLAAIQLAISPRAPSLMIAGGAGLAILGFLLPWADYVLGATGMTSYFDRWGLAGPGHPIILALVAVVAALGLVDARLPRWARPRTVAVAIACLLIGLAWPYLIGPYNASLGIFFVTVGAIVVIAGGLLGSAMSRHAGDSANV
jgi:hypothetical protein